MNPDHKVLKASSFQRISTKKRTINLESRDFIEEQVKRAAEQTKKNLGISPQKKTAGIDRKLSIFKNLSTFIDSSRLFTKLNKLNTQATKVLSKSQDEIFEEMAKEDLFLDKKKLNLKLKTAQHINKYKDSKHLNKKIILPPINRNTSQPDIAHDVVSLDDYVPESNDFYNHLWSVLDSEKNEKKIDKIDVKYNQENDKDLEALKNMISNFDSKKKIIVEKEGYYKEFQEQSKNIVYFLKKTANHIFQTNNKKVRETALENFDKLQNVLVHGAQKQTKKRDKLEKGDSSIFVTDPQFQTKDSNQPKAKPQNDPTEPEKYNNLKYQSKMINLLEKLNELETGTNTLQSDFQALKKFTHLKNRENESEENLESNSKVIYKQIISDGVLRCMKGKKNFRNNMVAKEISSLQSHYGINPIGQIHNRKKSFVKI